MSHEAPDSRRLNPTLFSRGIGPTKATRYAEVSETGYFFTLISLSSSAIEFVGMLLRPPRGGLSGVFRGVIGACAWSIGMVARLQIVDPLLRKSRHDGSDDGHN